MLFDFNGKERAALNAEVERLNGEMVALKDRLIDAIDRTSVLERDLETERGHSRKVTERFTDWVAQFNGQPSVFGNQYTVKRPEMEPMPATRRQARDVIFQMEQQEEDKAS